MPGHISNADGWAGSGQHEVSIDGQEIGDVSAHEVGQTCAHTIFRTNDACDAKWGAARP